MCEVCVHVQRRDSKDVGSRMLRMDLWGRRPGERREMRFMDTVREDMNLHRWMEEDDSLSWPLKGKARRRSRRGRYDLDNAFVINMSGMTLMLIEQTTVGKWVWDGLCEASGSTWQRLGADRIGVRTEKAFHWENLEIFLMETSRREKKSWLLFDWVIPGPPGQGWQG